MIVEHDERDARFFVRLGDDDAELTYTLGEPKRIDLLHTFVPKSARGHGVAEALAKAAFDYARERGLRVIPSCPFVRSWLRTHPEEVKLVDPPYVATLDLRPAR